MKHHLLLLVLLSVLILGFTACSSDDDGYYEQPLPGTELRALLKTLDWGIDTTFVYGHKVPDVDAVTSALSYARLMRSLNYNCKAKVSGEINRETQFISRHFGFAVPELKTYVAPRTRLILTDHTDYAQCVDGASEAIILQKIDHHVEGDIADAGIPYVRREMVGSTNTIIYRCFKELGVSIDDETARIMLAGIVSDTRNLTTTTTRDVDSTAWFALTTQLGISADSIAKINMWMEQASFDYSGMKDTDIFTSDYKDYEIGGWLIGIGSLICKAEEMDGFIDRMLAAMPEVMIQKNRQMLFAKIDNLIPNPDTSAKYSPYVHDGTYFIYYGEGTKEVAEAIFGASLREGVTYTKKNLSRKQIVPEIKKYFGE